MNYKLMLEKWQEIVKEVDKKYKIGVFWKTYLIFIIILEVPIDAYIQVKEIYKKDFSELIIGDVIKQWEVLQENLNVRA